MNRINFIDTEQNQQDLLNALIRLQIRVGMTEFNNKPETEKLPIEFQKIGNFELDVIAIEIVSNNIVMLDHDELSFKMGIAASSLKNFVKALSVIEIHFEKRVQNKESIDDVVQINDVVTKATEISGHKDFFWYYAMTLGI